LRGTDLQKALESSLRRHGVPGASVAVLEGGREVTAAAGIANVATGVDVTTDTLMHIGSITKLFTTTLVMQLVEEGRLELDDLVWRHLPELELADREALQRITVRMLLNHTSGIDGELLPDQVDRRGTDRSAQRHLASSSRGADESQVSNVRAGENEQQFAACWRCGSRDARS